MATHQESSQSQSFHWHYADFDDSNFQINGRTLFFIVVLFSIVLVISLLFLYARWVCRIDAGPLPLRIVQAPLGRRQGLDADTINSFPIVLHKMPISEYEEEEFGDGECCICLGIFADGEKVKVLPQCRHCFHSECVDKWLLTQSSCPLCRGSLRVDSLV